MKGFILAGGKGTRLRPITYEIPKVLLPVNRTPILNYLVELYLSANIKDIKINIRSEHKKQFFQWREKYYKNETISFLVEDDPSGTLGPLMKSKGWIDDNIVVSNGDELKDLSLDKFIDWHNKKDSLASVALVKADNPESYGVATLKEEKIINFVEKPQNPPSNYINSGLYIFNTKIKKEFPNKKFAMLEKDLFPHLAKEGKLHGYKWSGRWQDTGTLKRYEKAIKSWHEKELR